MSNPASPKAHIVPVWTVRLGGGSRMLVCYIAGYGDPGAAQEAVRRYIEALEGDKVGTPSPVQDTTAAALNVNPGDVRML